MLKSNHFLKFFFLLAFLIIEGISPPVFSEQLISYGYDDMALCPATQLVRREGTLDIENLEAPMQVFAEELSHFASLNVYQMDIWTSSQFTENHNLFKPRVNNMFSDGLNVLKIKTTTVYDDGEGCTCTFGGPLAMVDSLGEGVDEFSFNAMRAQNANSEDSLRDFVFSRQEPRRNTEQINAYFFGAIVDAVVGVFGNIVDGISKIFDKLTRFLDLCYIEVCDFGRGKGGLPWAKWRIAIAPLGSNLIDLMDERGQYEQNIDRLPLKNFAEIPGPYLSDSNHCEWWDVNDVLAIGPQQINYDGLIVWDWDDFCLNGNCPNKLEVLIYETDECNGFGCNEDDVRAYFIIHRGQKEIFYENELMNIHMQTENDARTVISSVIPYFFFRPQADDIEDEDMN